jgi:phosphoribosylamine--glycine ligase
MRILVVGSGAREHALAWRLARSGHEVLAAPGNPGIARVARCHAVAADDLPGLVRLTQERGVDLAVIGPEAPLALGLVDALAQAGVAAFGPTRAAAQLESSKAFAKEFMARHDIPTAPFRVVESVDAALEAARGYGWPAVLKADGLAAGKGVLVARGEPEARAFAEACLEENRFGEAGARLVVEAHLAGEETSLFFLSDGSRVARFLPARDYKRLEDGDRGPNTGGMGAYAPAGLDPGLAARIETDVALKTIRGMADEGAPFRGLLYVGLMLGPSGPRVLEYNARFGDPETQVLMPLVASDLGELFAECARGDLRSSLVFEDGAAVGVVLAAHGYPGLPRAGDVIEGLEDWPQAVAEDADERWCFHAGTRVEDGRTVAAGGRVLTVVARAAGLAEARRRAYEGLDRLKLAGGKARRDVALLASPAGRR